MLVYNIHAGQDSTGASNLEGVAAIVRDVRADIVLLQEVDRLTSRSGTVDQIARLGALTGMHTAFGKTLDYQGGEYGIALLSRWHIVRDTLLPLPVTPVQRRAGGSYEPRGLLYVVVARPGGEVHVLNTHLDASAGDENRIQEIEAVAAHAGVARGRGPSLLGGDLNATPESRVLGRLVAEGWTDAFAACGTGDGGTYPARAPIKRIDYLMLDSSWRCVEARPLVTEVSDHRPLLVRLTGVR